MPQTKALIFYTSPTHTHT